MGEKHELINLRVDDIVLIYAIVQTLDIKTALNEMYQPHGGWTGVSPGDILEIWLCFILSTADHRLSSVEKWVEARIELLRAMSNLPDLSTNDFTDDKLDGLLEVFAEDKVWGGVEKHVNKNGLSVYRFEEKQTINTFRIDAAPMQGYGVVKEEGLLQYGYHKQHANLPQFKVKLCTLDNEVNNFAYPVCHLTVEGNLADDALYQAIISNCKDVLSAVETYSGLNLYVGDKKFGSFANRV
jgi:transposase